MPATKTTTLTEALLAAQKDFPPIQRDATGQVGTRKYQYSSLSTLLNTVVPILNKHDLILTQRAKFTDAGLSLETVVRHTGGEELISEVPMPMPTDWQHWGSALTYARRYSLTAILGVAPEDDDDALSAQGFDRKAPARAPSAPAQRPQESKANLDALEALNAYIGAGTEHQAARIQYIKDVLAPKMINHPRDITDAEWKKVRDAAEGDLAARDADLPDGDVYAEPVDQEELDF